MSMGEPQRDSERKGVASFKSGHESVPADEEQVMMTINPTMGRLVRVVKIDKAGKHEEITEEDWSKLVGKDEVDEIESALEEAFEAGVAAGLGEEYEEDQTYEDAEDRDIRQILIGGLLRRSIRRRILQRLVMSRLLRSDSSKAAFSNRPKSPPQKGG
jgi:hypothetical protein